MKTKIGICATLFILLITACSPSPVAPTTIPVDIGAVQTAAAETIFDGMTQTVAAYTPTPESTETPTPIPDTATPSITETPTITLTPTESVCDDITFISDVTVPDGTEMAPGQEFVKTWKVKNTGSCTWKPNYTIIYGWGDDPNKMGGLPTKINIEVVAGAEAEISITLKAPTGLGTYHSYWRLQNNNSYNVSNKSLSVVIVVK